MAVIIKKVIDGSQEEIENGKYNIFVPISLGNLYFTRERLKGLTEWAIEHTKERVVILVADKIQAINYEVLRDMDKEQSKKAALRLGDDFVGMAERVIRSLSPEQQNKVSIARWEDIESDEFIQMQKIVKEEYISNTDFKTEVHNIVKDVFTDRIPNTEGAVNRLGDYVVEELPLKFKGITVKNYHYGIFLYPGLGNIDFLVSDIQNRKKFSGLADRLQLTEKQPVVEAYAEKDSE